MNLRKQAEGKSCYLRFDGCCHPETVVLCHLRIGGVAGGGQKPPDICALPGCHFCHGVFDGRIKTDLSVIERHHVALRGLVQWLAWLWNNEKIVAK